GARKRGAGWVSMRSTVRNGTPYRPPRSKCWRQRQEADKVAGMGSGQGWIPGAGAAVPGQRRADDDDREAPQTDHRGPWDRGGESAPPPREHSIDDSGLLGLRRPVADAKPQPRSRRRDLGHSTRREEPAASYEQLGEDDYWSYLPGER